MRNCLKNGEEPQEYFTTTCLKSEMGTVLQRQEQALNDQQKGAKIG